MSSTSNSTHSLLFLLLLAAVVALYGLGLDKTGLFDVDEAIFAQASVEMMESGDYVKPTYNAEPRYHKPPMIYWLQAASMEKMGIGPLGARLPSVILGVLTIFAFFTFLHKITGHMRYALTASTILAFSLSFLFIARGATADMLLNFFILTSIMTLLANLYAREYGLFPIFIAGFLLGAGLLAKGPIAVAVPAVVVGLAVLFKGRFFYNLKCVNPIILLVGMVLAVGPWCFHIIQTSGMDFFVEFIWVHNIQRYVGGLGNTHSTSYFYYLIVLLIGFFPWVLFLPGSIGWVFMSLWRRLRAYDPHEAFPAIGLLWMVAVIAFFTFSATKLAHYIVPALPGAALLIAARLDDIPQERLGGFALFLMLPFVLLFAAPFLILKWLPEGLLGSGPLMPVVDFLAGATGADLPVTDQQLVAILSQDITIGILPFATGAIVLCGTVAGLSLLNNGLRQGIFVLATTVWMGLTLTAVGVAPVVYQYMQQPLANIGEKIKSVHQEGDTVYMVELHQPSVRFISGVPFVPISSMKELEAKGIAGRTLLVVEQDRLEKVEALLPTWGQFATECEGGYCLVAFATK